MNKKQIFIVSFVSLALIIILSTTSNVTTKPKVNLKNVKDQNASSNCTNDKAYYGCKPSGGDDCGSPQSTIGTQQNACICNGNGVVDVYGECKCADGWGGVLCQHCDGDHYNPGGASSKSPIGSYGINPDIDLKCAKKVPCAFDPSKNKQGCSKSIIWTDYNGGYKTYQTGICGDDGCICKNNQGYTSGRGDAKNWNNDINTDSTIRQVGVDTGPVPHLEKCAMCLIGGWYNKYEFPGWNMDTCSSGTGFGCCSGTCTPGMFGASFACGNIP